MAIRIHASVVSGKASKSLLNRRERSSQPKGAFDDPTPLQDLKSLARPWPFHNRKGTLQNGRHPFSQLASVTPRLPR
jgi:hypothetical protein